MFMILCIFPAVADFKHFYEYSQITFHPHVLTESALIFFQKWKCKMLLKKYIRASF